MLSTVTAALGEKQGEMIRWPSRTADRVNNAYDFAIGDTGLQHCIGAIDGTHIPIKFPIGQEHRRGYFNRKKFMSILLQGIVSHRGEFIHVYTGWPGSVHDRVFFWKVISPKRTSLLHSI
jgi:hypothetical protein